MDLTGKVAVIAGATGGVGSAVARELAKNGAKLVLLGRNEEKLSELAGSLAGDHKYFTVDFTDNASIEEAAKKVLADFPEIAVLVNSAGYGVYKPIEEVEYGEWSDSFAIGVTAPYFLTKHLLPGLTKGESVVVNMGSGAGVIAMPGRSVYSIQKFALRGLTLSLAEEFKGTKTRFVLMTMGSILTEFGPMTLEEKKREMESGKAYFTPEWVAEKIVEIAEDDNRQVEYELYPSAYEGEWGAK